MNTGLPEDPRVFQTTDGTASTPHVRAAPARITVAITPRSVWLAAGVVLLLAACVFLLTKALSALVLIFISIILAEAIRPLVTRLQRHRLPQPLAVILIYLGVVAILAGLLWVLLNPVVTELAGLATKFPTYVANLQKWLVELEQNLNKDPAAKTMVAQLGAALASWAHQALPALLGVPIGVLTGVFTLLINVVLVLTMALFWMGCSTRFLRFVVGFFPPARRETVSTLAADVSKSLGGWVLGTLIAMFLIGSFTGLGLLILGIPYALLLGILAGFTELVPYLGPWISGTVAVVATLLTTGDPIKVVGVIILFLIIQEVEGNVVEPLVMNKTVHIDPWLVLVAILIGGELLGLVGVILAVPVAAVLQIVALEVVAPKIRVATIQNEP